MKQLPNISTLIQAILSYADDIVSIDKKEILDFFIKNNFEYRDDYIEFLSKFGGAQCKFLHDLSLDCSFKTIKSGYANIKEGFLIPEGTSYFAIPYFDDHYFIETKTGIIYREAWDNDGNIKIGDIYAYDILSFTFVALLFYENEFSERILNKEKINQNEIEKIEKELCLYHLNDIRDPNMRFYLKDNILYTIDFNSKNLYGNKLNFDFLEKIYRNNNFTINNKKII